jgi:hypothetical protein
MASTVFYCEHWTSDIVGLTEFTVQRLIHGAFRQDFVLFLIHEVVTFLVKESLFAVNKAQPRRKAPF